MIHRTIGIRQSTSTVARSWCSAASWNIHIAPGEDAIEAPFLPPARDREQLTSETRQTIAPNDGSAPVEGGDRRKGRCRRSADTAAAVPLAAARTSHHSTSRREATTHLTQVRQGLA